MRLWIFLVLLPGALTAQTAGAAGKAGPDPLRRLAPRPDWLQTGAWQARPAWQSQLFGAPRAMLAGGAVTAQPKVCSIPLLRAPEVRGRTDEITIKLPPPETFDRSFALPTPPVCAEHQE